MSNRCMDFPFTADEVVNELLAYYGPSDAPNLKAPYTSRLGILETLRQFPRKVQILGAAEGISPREFHMALSPAVTFLMKVGREADGWKGDPNGGLREKARGALIFSYLRPVEEAVELSRSKEAAETLVSVPDAVTMKGLTLQILDFFGEHTVHAEAGKNSYEAVYDFLSCIGSIFNNEPEALQTCYPRALATSRSYRLFLQSERSYLLMGGIGHLYAMLQLEAERVNRRHCPKESIHFQWWNRHDFLGQAPIEGRVQELVAPDVRTIKRGISQVRSEILSKMNDGGYETPLAECVTALEYQLAQFQKYLGHQFTPHL